MIELYVFDFDGTIIDSSEDLAAGVNAGLKSQGYWEIPVEKVVSFVGDGSKKLILRALSESTKGKFNLDSDYNKKQFDLVYKSYFDFYSENCVVKTKLYAGIRHLLETLKNKNKHTALLTNKPAKLTQIILEKLGLTDFFEIIVNPETTGEDGYQLKMKPEPDGLEYILRTINSRYGISLSNQNAIMLGDSAQDIIAGKAFGCKTVACRGGMGNREKLLEQNADFCFSVASEIEKFIDVLSKDIPANEETAAIQNYAMLKEVPIVMDEGSDFICNYIKEHNCKSVFEIGTAIGFSTVKFAKLASDIKVTTIEIDKERFEAAQENIRNSGVAERITSLFGDALEAQIDTKFDLIFIDAAKAQYTKFFEKYKSNLSENGVFISDNLSFHGMVEDLSLTHNYSTIKLVKKIRKYIEFLKNNEEFETEFFKLGDGIAVSKRRK